MKHSNDTPDDLKLLFWYLQPNIERRYHCAAYIFAGHVGEVRERFQQSLSATGKHREPHEKQAQQTESLRSEIAADELKRVPSRFSY